MVRFVEADDCAEEAAFVLSQSMGREGITPERFLGQMILDPNFRKEGSILALDGGRPVGYCLTVSRQTPVEGVIADSHRAYLWLMGVVPDQRGRGIGSELLERAERVHREEGKEEILASCYSPGYVQPGIDVESYPEGLEFLMKRGYEEVYRPIACQADLWFASPPEWALALKAARESEGYSFERNPRMGIPRLMSFAHRKFGPDWARFVRQGVLNQIGGSQRTGLAVALHNGSPAGFVHFEGERFGPIGVDEDQRGKGLGQILMWEALQMQKEAGMRTSWFLWSDDSTWDRLYRHAGFREVRKFALLKKRLHS